jgi:predicted TIM-barrel fold metal-dependent hydrolase
MSVVTDFHVHAFDDDLALRAVRTLNESIPPECAAVLDGTIGGLVRSMDEAGIGRSVTCPIATAPSQVGPILDWAVSIRSDRIVPFASVHPGCADMPAEVARIAAAGLLGIKLHPLYQGFAADERRMWPCYRAIADHRLILVLHCGLDLAFPADDERAHPERVLNVHRRFPEIPLVATHMGGWKRWEAVADRLAGTGVYLETSYSLDVAPQELLSQILDKHDADRIVFGTDSPLREQKEAVELVNRAFPDPEARRKVLRDNADRLLREAAEQA